jgi:two-component system, cell cycle sensor histidine kinase and response regulator CckA
MARTAQVLHLAESPNDSFLLRAELADEGIPCQLLSLAPGEDLARAVTRSSIDLLIVDVPLSSPHWRSGLDEIQRARPELPVIFRWGGSGHWSTESSSEQLGRRIRGVLAMPDGSRRTDLERREFLDRLVRHQQTYLELLRADTWDFDSAIRRVLERAADLLEVERVSVWEFTADRKALVCLDLFVRSTRAHERPAPVSSCPRYLATLESSLTLAADDARLDPRTSELAESYLRPLGIASMLDAPIRRDGRLVGVVCHEHIGQPRQWSVLDQCSSGSVAGLVARAMDVRERRQLAERLERAERLDSIGRLAGGLAHDFNNCLTAILCHVDLALDSRDDASKKEALDEIRALAHDASKLTRDLLTAGRASPVAMVPLDLGALIGSLTPRLTATMPAHGRLEIAPAAEPVWIRGDATALERVVVNLVSNAADAIAETGGLVRLALKRAPALESGAPVPSAASAAIEIVDDGVGMDATTQAHLFEPFFTTKGANGRGPESAGGAAAAQARVRPNGGVGLGLATAFGIVRQHGGTIAVESAPRQGSRFTVLLPAIPAPRSS